MQGRHSKPLATLLVLTSAPLCLMLSIVHVTYTTSEQQRITRWKGWTLRTTFEGNMMTPCCAWMQCCNRAVAHDSPTPLAAAPSLMLEPSSKTLSWLLRPACKRLCCAPGKGSYSSLPVLHDSAIASPMLCILLYGLHLVTSM